MLLRDVELVICLGFFHCWPQSLTPPCPAERDCQPSGDDDPETTETGTLQSSWPGQPLPQSLVTRGSNYFFNSSLQFSDQLSENEKLWMAINQMTLKETVSENNSDQRCGPGPAEAGGSQSPEDRPAGAGTWGPPPAALLCLEGLWLCTPRPIDGVIQTQVRTRVGLYYLPAPSDRTCVRYRLLTMSAGRQGEMRGRFKTSAVLIETAFA